MTAQKHEHVFVGFLIGEVTAAVHIVKGKGQGERKKGQSKLKEKKPKAQDCLSSIVQETY